MQRLMTAILAALFLVPGVGLTAEKGLTVKSVRYFSYPAFTRIVFELEAAGPYQCTKSGDGKRVILSASEGPLVLPSPLPSIQNGIVDGVEWKEEAGRKVISVRLENGTREVKDFVLRGPDRIVLDIAKGASERAPASAGKSPVVVVLDPGHGGTDTGIVTAFSIEKIMTLELAEAIKIILQKDSGLNVVLTREKDQSLSLEERAAKAYRAGASVFVTIHMAPGVLSRVYIQEEAHEQESNPVTKDLLGFDAGSTDQEMLWGKQQAAYAGKSMALGRGLARQLEGRDVAEPVQAPVAGLRAVSAAAVMIEAGMDQDRVKTADAVAKGIERYVGESR